MVNERHQLIFTHKNTYIFTVERLILTFGIWSWICNTLGKKLIIAFSRIMCKSCKVVNSSVLVKTVTRLCCRNCSKKFTGALLSVSMISTRNHEPTFHGTVQHIFLTRTSISRISFYAVYLGSQVHRLYEGLVSIRFIIGLELFWWSSAL